MLCVISACPLSPFVWNYFPKIVYIASNLGRYKQGLPLGKRTDVISDQDDKDNVFPWNNDGTALPVILLKELGFYVQHSLAVIHTHCIWSVYLCPLHTITVELGKRVYGNPMQTGSSRTLLCHE